MKKLLSTILALALALSLALALVSCGCSGHVDADNNGKCDECEANYCATHVDADKNGVCDHEGCGAPVACVEHTDANGDRVCDVPGCGAYAEPTPCATACADANKDGLCDTCRSDVAIYAAEIFAMIAESTPTKTTTIHSVSVDEVPYVGSYVTIFYAENYFSHEYSVTTAAPAGSPEATITETGVIVYNNGVITVDGEPAVGDVEVKYLGIQRKITPANVLKADDSNASLDKTGTELTLTLTAKQCQDTFGISVNASKVDVTITTNGTRLSKIVIGYEANGAVVTIETSYSYEPVTAPQA